MTIDFDADALGSFFGQPGAKLEETELETYVVDYKAEKLNYTFLIRVTEDLVHLGCSFEEPFGADSLFEVGVPCDSIRSIPDGYYPEQLALGFWFGNPDERQNCTMQLLKRPDGHLKIWPAYTFPERHMLHSLVWGDNRPSRAYAPRK